MYCNAFSDQKLWFDVEIGYYTTVVSDYARSVELWFDVEIGYYTTEAAQKKDEE